MSDTNTLWIVIAAVVVIAIVVGLALVARQKRRRVAAEKMRTELEAEREQVAKRQALADETDARARAAAAEAEAKAAEARRLADRASSHQQTVAEQQVELEERSKRNDKLDPDVKTGKRDDRAEVGDASTGDTPRRVDNLR